MPEAYASLCHIADSLERHFRDLQDIEFTIERGKLYMLQTRNGKRTAAAAMQVAVDMVEEGIVSREGSTAFNRRKAAQYRFAPNL